MVGALAFSAGGCGSEEATRTTDVTAPAASGSGMTFGQARVVFEGSAGAVSMEVEVARTNEQRARGLMERRQLDPERGMLFVWESPQRSGFWMKNTYIPLSIAFIDADGKIVDIQDMEPLSLEQHAPPSPYIYAVEANQGYFAQKGISVGDAARVEGLS